MLVFRHISSLVAHLGTLRREGYSLAFVPTMGALHNGHMSLIDIAQSKADKTLCSIYVNPTQFNDKADLANYPRTVEQDLSLLDKRGCDVVWLPQDQEMYPSGEYVERLNYGLLTQSLEGEHRPGHFDGMGTIVKGLLTHVNPDMACFGEKDFQQLAIIRKLVADHQLKTEIMGCPIVREDSGLAMSSRNRRLSGREKEHALVLSKTLTEMRQKAIRSSAGETLRHGLETLRGAQGVELDYLSIVDAQSFEPVSGWQEGVAYRVLVAATVGEVRLIDNMPIP